MSLPTFAELMARIDDARPRIPVVAAGGDDATVLSALGEAARRGWVAPIVTGNRQRIEQVAGECGVDLAPFRVIDSDAPAEAAVAAIRAGEAAALMKGQIDTPALMRAVLHRETGLRTEHVVGQIVLTEIPRDHRVFLVTDTGITIQPTLDQKRDLLRSLLDRARRLSSDPDAAPRIAIMAASEKVNPAMPETEDAASLAEEAKTGVYGPCAVEGPLSFDLAYASEAGERKKLAGGVIGAAEGMLFPNLSSANLTIKAIMYTADCAFGGQLCGTSAPVVFMSRADSTETRLRSLAFTLSTLPTGD